MKHKLKSILIACLIVFSIQMAIVSPEVRAGVPTASQWATPLELDFGPVGLGSTSPTLIVKITNSGNTPLTGWAGGGVPAPFSAFQDCAGGVLPGDSCHFYFTFSPTTAGTYSATSSSTSNAGPINIILHGQGVGARATYHSLSLDFGSVFTSRGIAGVAPTQVVTITNTGLAPLTGWAGGGVPAPFSAFQDCAITGGVLPGDSCHYYFGFSTTSTGTFTATSTSTTNGGTISVDLSGQARSILLLGGQQVTPRSLDFGPVGVGNTSQLVVAVTNNDVTNNITGWAGGGVPSPFNASQDCAITGGLPPGSTCHYYFTFNPTSAGPFSAVSTTSDSLGSFSINLQGTGVAPTMTANPLWLDFGPVSLRLHSQQIVTITNTGLSPLTGWAGGAVPAPFSASQDCAINGGVLPGQSCHFFYTFSPTSLGSFSATSTFSTNAGNISIKLQGQGVPIPNTFLPFIQR